MWIIGAGDVIDRRYRIERELGEGGMAYVFAARDEELGEPVALKVIRPELVGDPELVTRFKREVRIARQIHHPNVVRIFEFGRTELAGKELYYMTMELLSGRDLKRHRARSVAEMLGLGIQICEGLEAAHRVGVIHRDVKPQNVFVDDSGRARVMDFGISRLVTLTGLTRGSQFMGTPHYMSPEQVSGKKDIDHRSDIYSVGVLLYELATGRVPFEGKTPVEVALRHLQDLPAAPRRINPRLPSELERIILTCLSKEPDRRYGSAAELGAELDRLSKELEKGTISIGVPGPSIAGEDSVGGTIDAGHASAPNVSPTELVTTRRARGDARGAPLALYGASAAVLVLAIAGYLALRPSPPEPSEEAKIEVEVEPAPQPPVTTTTSVVAAREPVTTVPGSAPAAPVSAPAPAPPASAPAPAPPVAVRISANPGTEVFVDGELAGTVPPIVELSLLPGQHRIRYRIPDYEELETEVEVRSGADNSFSHRFAPYGILRVTAQPYARVELDGKDLGFTPLNLSKVREGEHRLVLHREGFESIVTTVVVKPGDVNLYQFEMER
jgi:hypothetical protein